MNARIAHSNDLVKDYFINYCNCLVSFDLFVNLS
nr:MAG TPA: hypothetical protein [Caudoviricetes sp.]